MEEACYKPKLHISRYNIVEYLNTAHTENQFVNIAKSHKNNQPNMCTKLKVVEELNQSNEDSDTKKKTFNPQKQN